MKFALVFHNHQPVGQLPWVFEEAYEQCYAPFVEVLEQHAAIRVALHYTGPLLDWLAEHQPAFLSHLRTLVQHGQVEILAGGDAEPILAIWPREDQEAQIRRSIERVAELFGVAPRGLWLAERVWEPPLAEVIRACGLNYTLVDGAVFAAAGVPERESFGVFEAESADSSNVLRLLPINKRLRDLVPWHQPQETLEYLQRVAQESGEAALATFADDGEKFGAWPGTYKFIFEDGWLEKFFEALETASDWLQTVLPGDDVMSRVPLRRVALPAGSYPEMQAWSGGNWRHFLERYRESRDMWEEVERVHPLVAAHPTAYAHLLRAQCNDAYWHGTFGGLYLRHLRQAVYAEAARAQRVAEGDTPFCRASVEPNGDAVLENERQKLLLRAEGGCLFGWVSKLRAHNLGATLRRYRERYHDENSVADWYGRAMMVEHIFGPYASPEGVANARFSELGDFASEAWMVEAAEPSDGQAGMASVTLSRRGGVWQEGAFLPLEISKTLRLAPGNDQVGIRYAFTNFAPRELSIWWGSEWNLALTASTLPDRHYHPAPRTPRGDLEEIEEFEAVTNPIVADNWLGLQVEWQFPEPVGMWHLPIYTFSEKEGGDMERTYQQSAWVFHRRLTLPPSETVAWEHSAILVPAAE